MTMKRQQQMAGCGVFTFFALVIGVLAAQGMPEDTPAQILAKGSTQAVLSMCLLAVAGAVVMIVKAYQQSQRELVQAQRDRIVALETAVHENGCLTREVSGSLTLASAAMNAMKHAADDLRVHCAEARALNRRGV